MKKIYLIFLFLVLFMQTGLIAQFAPLPPFSISIEKVVTSQTIPGFHSFAFGQLNSKWLVIGGRTNGLHSLNANEGFNPDYNNNFVTVIDTGNWQSYYSCLSNLPYSVADPLRSSNMQYFQDGDYLYMVGGYGRDSVQNKFVTFNTLSSIRIDSMIDAVMNGQPIAPYIRQITNPSLKLCGGDLQKVGPDFYLMFGQIFTGRYDHGFGSGLFLQKYQNEIRKFNIVNTGGSISVTNFSARADTNNFHRRDLTVSPIINSAGQQSLMAFGGVFQKDADIPYLEPIEIGVNADSVYAYQQVMSHYTCANIPVYDSVNQDMYTTFLGGISINDYDPNTNTVIGDTLVPFISDITTFTKRANGLMEESILPVQLPYLLGSNAKFVLRTDVPQYANGVINLKAITGRILAGYLLGGISADAPNQSTTTVANDTVYRIYIDPAGFNAIAAQKKLISQFNVFPNPANDQVHLDLKMDRKTKLNIKLINNSGKAIKDIFTGEVNPGSQQLHIGTSELSSGLYYIKLITENGTQTFPVSIAH
ncbi:MAG: T9SS type A sorting domain-containing protein [Bacteroidia bacterium]